MAKYTQGESEFMKNFRTAGKAAEKSERMQAAAPAMYQVLKDLVIFSMVDFNAPNAKYLAKEWQAVNAVLAAIDGEG